MPDNNKDVVVTIRVPSRLAERIEELTQYIAEQREFSLKSKINRSDAIRYLILTGLETLEKRQSEEHP